MIQCSACEHCTRGPDGQLRFTCDPFNNIKEPECLMKWQLLKINTMVQAYQATLTMYQRLAPLQEKMFRHMQAQIDDIDEADQWKYEPDENDGPESGDEDDSSWR